MGSNPYYMQYMLSMEINREKGNKIHSTQELSFEKRSKLKKNKKRKAIKNINPLNIKELI